MVTQVMTCIMEGLQHLGRTLQREKLNCFPREILSSSWNTMHDQWQVITAYAALIAVTVWMLLGLRILPRGLSGGGGRRKSSLPGPIRWPLLGAAPEVLWNYHRLNDWIVSYLKKSPTMHVQLPSVTFTYTVLPENVEHILKNNFSNYPKGELFHELMDIFLGDGIFNTDGELWRKQRKTASFEFASKVLREFSTLVFRDYSLKLAAILNRAAASTAAAVDMQDLFMRLTMDSICKISFGIEMGALEPSLPDIPFAKAFETTNEIVSHRFMDPWWKLKRFFKVGTEATVVKSAKEVDDFTYNVIRTRRAELAAARRSGLKLQADAVQSQVTKDLLGRRDLFTRFLLLNEEAEEGAEMFTDKNLRDTMLNFVIAGRDTTAVTLSWFVYMMIQHPEVAEKIEQELICTFEKSEKEDQSAAPTIMNSKKSGIDDDDDSKASDEASFNLRVAEYSQHFTYDSLLNLQYLYAAILETLRLYPAVPMDAKSVLNDDVFPDGTPVKKGNMVMYSAYAMGRMEYIWGSDACEFKPSRWLKDGVVQLESPFKFTAFQAGPRICLGKDSAMLQLRMVLAILCRFYKFQLVSQAPVKYRQMSILLVANGLHVTVTRKM
ncbi:hypothetical protein BDL97_14G103200 [Sphagnum fallax]|nr:hypothetical protein BDL97_14G103200 [Sphagnum fallax]